MAGPGLRAVGALAAGPGAAQALRGAARAARRGAAGVGVPAGAGWRVAGGGGAALLLAGGWEVQVAELAAGGGGRAEAEGLRYKGHAVRQQPVHSFLRPRTLVASALRNFFLHFAPLLDQWGKAIEEAEREHRGEGEVEWPPFPSTRAARAKFCAGFCREGAVHTVRRVLEHGVAARASARTTWKLLKDVPRSAVRKARRAEGALWTARTGGAQVARVTRTAVRGNSLVTLADFIVRQATDFHLIFREQAGLRAPRQRALAYGKCTLGNALHGGICLALVGACAGTLSLVPGPDFWPALPPLAGMFLGDFVGAQVSGALVVRLCLAKHQI